MKEVLIISSKDDAHVDLLEPRLRAYDCRVFRVNTEEFLQQNAATLTLGANNKRLVLDHVEINPVSCWYRKPTSPLFKDSSIPSVQKFVKNESVLFWSNFVSLIDLGVRWINHPILLATASVKLNQLIAATRNGLQIPETIITNDPKEAESFCEQLQWNVIAKTIGPPVVKIDGVVKNSYARRLGRDKAEQLKNIKVCPTILQRYIASRRELRVTVIGTRVFAVEIGFEKSKYADWRGLPDDKLTYRDFDLCTEVTEKLLSLLKDFGLHFSTMDLVEDNEGIWYFLDLNPNGQWLWLNKHSKQGIADYFLKFLTKNE